MVSVSPEAAKGTKFSNRRGELRESRRDAARGGLMLPRLNEMQVVLEALAGQEARRSVGGGAPMAGVLRTVAMGLRRERDKRWRS